MAATNLPKQTLMPMRSDERLAQSVAQRILCRYPVRSLLDVGCGDGIVSKYLGKQTNYQGLDINDACIYQQQIDSENISYIESKNIPKIIKTKGPWGMILLLDVIEHTRDFTGLFKLSMQSGSQFVVVSLPNELFILDRLRMLAGKELAAHSLDLIDKPEGFKHQYIINIAKARQLLNQIAEQNNFTLLEEVARPLKAKNYITRSIYYIIRRLSSMQAWSMGSIFIYKNNDI